MATTKALEREEERELVQRWRDGDEAAGKRLIAHCLPVVVAIAFEYRRWGVPAEDIVQQGTLGLLRAASKFDAGRDCRLATYAAYWIRAEIREFVIRTYRVVRLGTTKAEKRALRAYRRTRESDPAALAEASGLTRERAEWLLPLLASREASLEAGAGVDGRTSVLDRLAGPAPTPEEEATTRELRGRARVAIRRALGDLTERERVIVRERLMSDDPRTLQELGTTLGVSKERVRQLEERVCDKLRARLEQLRSEAA